MRPAFHIEIETPKKVLLNGLWLGPKKAKRVIVWIHGLGSSMFSKLSIADLLVDSQTAVLVFNNRGHDRISNLRFWNRKKGKFAGEAHEVFTESADDVQGAIDFARKAGAKEIFLAGHSTGCQKSLYWAYKKKGRGVKGIILLAPISDYSSALTFDRERKLSKATSLAHRMVKDGKGADLLPARVWPGLHDAQRFLSLYSEGSVENIFSYASPDKNPNILRSVRPPTLVVLAEDDEFGDMPATEIAQWFKEHLRSKHAIVIVPNASHGFREAERTVASHIRTFMK